MRHGTDLKFINTHEYGRGLVEYRFRQVESNTCDSRWRRCFIIQQRWGDLFSAWHKLRRHRGFTRAQPGVAAATGRPRGLWGVLQPLSWYVFHSWLNDSQPANLDKANVSSMWYLIRMLITFFALLWFLSCY